MTTNPQDLSHLTPRHETLIGIDSDGCVFDSMGVKQKTVFHTRFIERWGLETVEPVVRETLEFVNLYSSNRGQDRFVTFAIGVDMLAQRPELAEMRDRLPDVTDLHAWLATGGPFGNAGLEALLADGPLAGSKDLAELLAWSHSVDEGVRGLDPIPAFPHAVRFIEQLAGNSDAIVVSSTPLGALELEWNHAGLRDHVRLICSKDLGTKVRHLELATAHDKYAKHRVLMVGDAPKDLQSARHVGVRFFPILPGSENTAWARLCDEVYPAFLADSWSPAEEEAAAREFMDSLPETPPWETT